MFSGGFGLAFLLGDAGQLVPQLGAVARALTDILTDDELTAVGVLCGLHVVAPDEESTVEPYLITYADRTTLEIPVRLEARNINSLSIPTTAAQRLYPDGGFFPTWKGTPISESSSSAVLYVKSWTKPRSDVPVLSIDAISSSDPDAPALMLFGITAEHYPDPAEEKVVE